MELIGFLVLAILISIGSFWLAGLCYGFFHRPAIYFPLSLASKMAICAVFGSLFLMVGGIILSTLVFNAEMAKRPDYEKWPAIIAGSIISILCLALIYFSVIGLAWKILN